ncbi:Dabb family protein [Solwaraspora sp. WMMD791]|uniref:Dabb family protein n=1 Tax=Solwaraspora sp. WMMD791 TaxID=3016086 RepID=UPI00249AFC61|nr:Dabb family protein [Solwaraspora sp. WMMD791]WFE28129.1 Dabb family protein [Solwaraspora sp. WMMD791]
MLTHVVLMRLTDAADAPRARQLLAGLAADVPQCRSLVVGADVGHGPYSWDLALISTHDDAAGLAAYQAHPRHLEVVGWLGPRLAERAIVDF